MMTEDMDLFPSLWDGTSRLAFARNKIVWAGRVGRTANYLHAWMETLDSGGGFLNYSNPYIIQKEYNILK